MNGDYQHAYYPVSLDLDGRLVVVLGGDLTAERHVLSLLRYGADVLVVAPAVTDVLDALVAEGRIEHEARDYVRGDIAGAFLAVCATDSVDTARAVYLEAEGEGCLVTTPDAPELCNCVTPAVVERGLMQVAVSTAGASPALAEVLRDRLEDDFGLEWADYVLLLGKVRRLAVERGFDASGLAVLDAAIVSSDLMERVVAGERLVPEEVFRSLVFPEAGEAAPDRDFERSAGLPEPGSPTAGV